MPKTAARPKAVGAPDTRTEIPVDSLGVGPWGEVWARPRRHRVSRRGPTVERVSSTSGSRAWFSAKKTLTLKDLASDDNYCYSNKIVGDGS